MRIRKNAKLSPLWFSHASAPESLQAHVCQLNQSPWDVLPLTHQFEGDDSLTGNASLGDSIGAVESVASMMDAVAAKAEDMVLAVNDNDVVEKKGRALDQRARENEFGGHGGFEKAVEKRSSSCCQKTDGKGWQCRNEAKEGQSLCEHHLNLLRSYNTGNSNSSSMSFRKSSAAAAAAAAAAAGARRARARAAKKGSSSASNPYEFYYYSGFGPLWGRKRGDRSGGGGGSEDGTKSTHQEAAAKVVVVENVNNSNNNNNNNNNNNSVSAATQSSTPSSSSQFDNEEFDYVDDEDEDDGGDSGKKRMRKPVKARSLKSLM